MNVTIKLIVHTKRPTATAQVITINGDLGYEGTLTPHEIAGVLFASEFSINNHASEMCGMMVRAHIDLKE